MISYIRKKPAGEKKKRVYQTLLDHLEIRIANLPTLPLLKSNARISLLAELLVSKYMGHFPFHRQLGIFKWQNVHFSASTVKEWSFNAVSLLNPLYEKLRHLILESNYIGVDESTVPALDNEKQKSIKAYLWIVRHQ